MNAAFALIAFSDDPSVAISCFEQLQDPAVQEKPLLRTYLLGCYPALRDTPYQEAFVKMAHDPNVSSELRADMQQILKEWSL